MIAPASEQLAEHFDIRNSALLAMTTSVFVLAYGRYRDSRALCIAFPHSIVSAITIAFGPLLLGPLSELYGRSHVLQISNLWYLGICFLNALVSTNGLSLFTVWNLACGFARSRNELIAFRFLAGLGGSAPLAIGGAVIGDLFDVDHRGQAISIYSLAPLLGPVVGPVAGAWIAEKSTWRWVVRLWLLHVTYTTALTVTT
jgi:MFS family permease